MGRFSGNKKFSWLIVTRFFSLDFCVFELPTPLSFPVFRLRVSISSYSLEFHPRVFVTLFRFQGVLYSFISSYSQTGKAVRRIRTFTTRSFLKVVCQLIYYSNLTPDFSGEKVCTRLFPVGLPGMPFLGIEPN